MPQVPSAAPNNCKSVQRQCVGVSVNGCALGARWWGGVQSRSCKPSDKGVEQLSSPEEAGDSKPARLLAHSHSRVCNRKS